MRAFRLVGSWSIDKVVLLNNPSKDKTAGISNREGKTGYQKQTHTGTGCLLIACAQSDKLGENTRTKTVSYS